MRYARYANVGQIHVRLKGKPIEEVYCYKNVGSQVASDGGCGRDVVHRMNKGYKRGEH